MKNMSYNTIQKPVFYHEAQQPTPVSGVLLPPCVLLEVLHGQSSTQSMSTRYELYKQEAIQ